MNETNGDPDFNKTLIQIFGSDSIPTRRNAFLFICIPVRTLLYLSIFYLCKYDIVIFIILCISAYTAVRLYLRTYDDQWWSKKFDMIVSILIFIFCCLSFINNKYKVFVPISLMISLIGGISIYIFKTYFSS